jgi:hypothetical protein
MLATRAGDFVLGHRGLTLGVFATLAATGALFVMVPKASSQGHRRHLGFSGRPGCLFDRMARLQQALTAVMARPDVAVGRIGRGDQSINTGGVSSPSPLASARPRPTDHQPP